MNSKQEYFSHDYNSRQDPKIKRLLRKHGMYGYGVFWSLVELLYINSNQYECDIELLAYDFNCDAEILRSVVYDFELFVLDDNIISSLSIQKRLDLREESSQQARDAAKKRWEKYRESMREQSDSNATALPPQSDSNAIKGNKSKENEIIKDIPPSAEFLSFQRWVERNASNVSKMKEPLTETQYLKLMEDFDMPFIQQMLLSMHNWTTLKKNASANLTFRNWAKRDGYTKPNATQKQEPEYTYLADGGKLPKGFAL